MNFPSTMKLVPALIISVLAGNASAAAFQLLEQNASGLGNAYAGSAAVAENASTIFYNPAGMTQLKDREMSTGVTAVATSFKFNDKGSSVGFLTGTGTGGDGGGWGFIPNAYMSWALNKDVYVGLGVGAPFGSKTEYDNPWVGAAQATMFDLKTYNINPSVAYRVNDKVSVGAGLSWQRLTAEYVRQVAVVSAVTAVSPLTLDLNGDSWGWNAGALFTVSPATKVGVSYRSTVKYDLTGGINITGPSAALNASRSSGAKANLELPDTFILSGTHQLSDKVQLLGDISWTGWSSIPKLDIVRTSGTLTGQIAQTLDTEFRDSTRVAVGVNYQYRGDLKLKFGLAYDQTPVKGASTRLVSLPDNDRTWLSTGVQWTVGKGGILDVGATYLLLNDSQIDNNQLVDGRGKVTGDFTANAWIFGLQYSRAF
jgi:long-chain fatty acid transport protein